VSPADPDTAPRNVLLFSGHMIDAPGRKEPRLPASKEPVVADAITRLLDSPEIAANSSDLAICGGACGGDLLFAEACLARGTALELYIPLDENSFLANSIAISPPRARARCTLRPMSSGRSRPTTIPTSAITSGCWNAPRVSALRR
jgi:hypothetical protein